ncbi:MAG: flagellar hook-basal body complex protein [Candidatus Melainabacteria bacterium]|nr:flagellar hook-basal body complex protein [Candidatus Melainabacteria bacterium]
MPIPSLFTGAGALSTQQNAISVIANNIANVNTTGFKGSRVHFSEAVSSTLSNASAPSIIKGGKNPGQIGTGLTLSDINSVFSQGSLKQTGNVTDLAISGNGFFVISASTPDGTNEILNPEYTRDGHFLLDADGNLVTADGAKVMAATLYDHATEKVKSISGYSAITFHTDQTIGPAGSPTMYPNNGLSAPNLALPTPTVTNVTGSTPAFTAGVLQELSIRGGLIDENTGVTTGTPGDLTISRRDDNKLLFTFDDANGGTSDDLFTAAIDTNASILDGVLSFEMTNGSDDKLQMRIRLEPGVDSLEDAFANIEYDSTTQTSDTMVFSGAAATTQVGSNITVGNDDFEHMKVADVSDLYSSIKIPNFLYDQDSALERETNSFTISSNGTISIIGPGSEELKIARLLMSNFINPDGLKSIGANRFQQTANSGLAATSVIDGPFNRNARSINATQIVSGALESSNVNIADEFAELIAFQRGLQFNATTVQRSDDVLQTLINLG